MRLRLTTTSAPILMSEEPSVRAYKLCTPADGLSERGIFGRSCMHAGLDNGGDQRTTVNFRLPTCQTLQTCSLLVYYGNSWTSLLINLSRNKPKLDVQSKDRYKSTPSVAMSSGYFRAVRP